MEQLSLDVHEILLVCVFAMFASTLMGRRIFSQTKIVEASDLAEAVSPARSNLMKAVTLPSLDALEARDVKSGKMIFRPYRNDAGINRGVAIQLVRASPQVVWQTILDFDEYPTMVDDVCAARVYERSEAGDIKVAYDIGYGVVHFTACLHHHFSQRLSQMTWTLDASNSRFLKHNQGFWAVRPCESNSSIVYYSIAIEVNGWIPSWVNAFVANAGLPRAVAWLKKHAERRQIANPTTQPSLVTRSPPPLCEMLVCSYRRLWDDAGGRKEV